MIHFTFHISGLDVVAIASLKASSQEYYGGKYPNATHLVMAPHSQVVYAVADSEAEAVEARRKLLEVSTR